MGILELVKAERFGDVEADIYSNGTEMFMTISQLAACLEYADKRAIEKLLERNEYLKEEQFSFIQKVPYTTGGTQQTRTFTEDGIYEVTMLSKQPKAREFRAWIRGILKALRRGEAQIVPMTDYQKKIIETREQEVHLGKAQLLERIAEGYQGTFRQVLQAHATKELTGEFLLPLPEIKERTYSATEIGDMVGITAHMVGALANKYGLKTEKYGLWYNDKARNSNKEVPSFRYFESVIPALRAIIENQKAEKESNHTT